MTVDLLAHRKRLNKIFGSFVYAQIAINAIWRLALRHVVKESLESEFLGLLYTLKLLLTLLTLLTQFGG